MGGTEGEGYVVVDVDEGVLEATPAASSWLHGERRAVITAFVRAHHEDGPAHGLVEDAELACEPLLGGGEGRYLVRFSTAPSEVTELTPRQNEVAQLAARGATAREIATYLGIGTYTVKQHLAAVYERLHVGSRVELAAVLWGV